MMSKFYAVSRHVEVCGKMWTTDGDGECVEVYSYMVSFEDASERGAVYCVRVKTDIPKSADDLVDYAYSRKESCIKERRFNTGVPSIWWREEDVDWEPHMGALAERCTTLQKMFHEMQCEYKAMKSVYAKQAGASESRMLRLEQAVYKGKYDLVLDDIVADRVNEAFEQISE